ncbi:MAG: hypothetical protein LBC80_04415 [Treponema sp.]|jgi:hypothetical protein|nr:hypothetical protein [Treponema sp.]
MNKIYVMTVLMVIGGVCSAMAQDLIVLRDGNMIEARVVEISEEEIRYRRFDNLLGPMYVLSVSRVQSIIFENGIIEVFNAEEIQTQSPINRAYTPPVPTTPEIAESYTVISVIGHVQRSIEGSWTDVRVGDILSKDTLIRTNANSSLVITDGNNTITIPAGVFQRISSLTETQNANRTARQITTQIATANNNDKLVVGINANPAGLLFSGFSSSIEFTKGNFNNENNLIFPSTGGFGLLSTFNQYWHSQNGGAYLGGGLGYIFIRNTSNLFTLGLNAGYRFVASSGIILRAGGYIGLGITSDDIEIYFKPDLVLGYSF